METALNIGDKLFVRQSNAMWDILLQTKETVKSFAGSILTTKSLSIREREKLEQPFIVYPYIFPRTTCTFTSQNLER